MVSALQPLAVSMQISSDVASLDITTWFATRVNDLKAFGAFWHDPTRTCQQQQAFISTEIKSWDEMTDQKDHQTTEYLISRRMALATLATLSTSLLTKMQFGSLTTIVIEEFLAESTTSIVACWHLLRGDGLVTVEHALPKFLPLLIALIKQYPLYKEKASYLASQSFLLLSLVALHRLRFSERVEYCKQAVEFAREADDHTLLVTSLTHLGDAFFTNGQSMKMLHIYQQAEYYSRGMEISQFLRSKVLAELAHAYAQQGNDQETFRNIGEARQLFSEERGDTPVFLSTDYGLFQLILFEGLSTLGLGNYEEIQENTLRAHDYYQEATNKLKQIEQLAQTVIIPERIRVEIVNQRALVNAKAGNLDEFEKYFMEGVNGAKALASEKRRQEAIANWKAARAQWPHEKKILELADVLF
jgi:tetratricopeptide (TPR) repeat protein